MKLVRLLLVTLCAAAGLVVFTQVPAVACSCVTAGAAQHVEWADTVFTGTLTDIEQTEPDGDAIQSSLDPASYTFEVDETFKGDAGDGVVESARSGASCGLEGMELDGTYVVFAGENKAGVLEANLCGGTAPATPRLVEEVEAALAPATAPATPTATGVPAPGQPVPTQVPSGLQEASGGGGTPAWAWFGGGVLLAVVGGAAAVRLKLR
ncbi:MAG: hypothetical protein WKF50_01015 [Nocardioides sp.]